jgi:serine phosphatase RsbU (regulator of sigma subunit)
VNLLVIAGILTLFTLGSCQKKTVKKITAKNGVMNLKDWDFEEDGVVNLIGEWSFYYNQLLEPSDWENGKPEMTGHINVPGAWNGYQAGDSALGPFGYATYRLLIITDSVTGPLMFKTDAQVPAFRYYVNGKMAGKNGTIGTSRENMVPELSTGFQPFLPQDDTLEVLVQVSNYQIDKGGLIYDIHLGTVNQVNKTKRNNLIINVFLIGCFVIMGLYHIGLYARRPKDKSPLYFAIAALNLSLYFFHISLLFDFMFPEAPFEISFKLLRSTLYLTVPTFTLFVYSLFPKEFTRLAFRLFLVVSMICVATVLLAPSYIHSKTVGFYRMFILVSTFYSVIALVIAYIRKRQDSGAFLIGFAMFFLTVANDTLFYAGVIHSINLTPFGLFIFIFSQTYILSSRFMRAFNEAETLSLELYRVNQNLELTVQKRTAEVVRQKEEIEKKNLNITNSISYASRIQNALLPSIDQFKQTFKDFFILFKPLDMVSGDFYWIKKNHSRVHVAVADCTGHGVPGAFMSMLGISYLNEFMKKDEGQRPNEILCMLRNAVKQSLHQTGKAREAKDGMDMVLCSFDLDSKVLQFSGANLSVILVRNGEWIRHKGDKMPIGIHPKEKAEFTPKQLELQENDCIYLFSDGYIHQIGGFENTKFMARRMRELILSNCDKPMAEQKEILDKAIEKWKGNKKQTDDMLVMGIRI